MQVRDIRETPAFEWVPNVTSLLSEWLGHDPAKDLPLPRVAVALSGGADSMALTLMADRYARERRGRIIALTVDHRLRAESTDEAHRVAGWMRERGIAHHILTPEHHDVSNNLQEAARIWRYDAIAEFCTREGMLHCLIAHTANDNRETLLHASTRDPSGEDISGMAHTRLYRGVRFLRPLLEIERASLEAYLRAQNAAWIDDPSNQNTRFARVRNRKALAHNNTARMQLDQDIRMHAAARHARDNAVTHAAMECVRLDPLGFAEIALGPWRQLAPTLASQLLADTITTVSGATHRPRAHETARLIAALSQPFKKRTLLHCELTQIGDRLRIAREASRVEPPVILAGQGQILWDKRFQVRFALPASRTFTLRALGHDGARQLRQRTAPSAAPIPLATPSLWHLDELLSVPYISETAESAQVRIGFAPPKPLAASPFW